MLAPVAHDPIALATPKVGSRTTIAAMRRVKVMTEIFSFFNDSLKRMFHPLHSDVVAKLMCEGLCSHQLRILERYWERLIEMKSYPPRNMFVDVDLLPCPSMASSTNPCNPSPVASFHQVL